jgi:hypothetical protein
LRGTRCVVDEGKLLGRAASHPSLTAAPGCLGTLPLQRLPPVGLGRVGCLPAILGVRGVGLPRSGSGSAGLPVLCLPELPVGPPLPLPRLGFLTVLRRPRPLFLGIPGAWSGRPRPARPRRAGRLSLLASLLGWPPMSPLPLLLGMPVTSVRSGGGGVSGPPPSVLPPAMRPSARSGATTTVGGLFPCANRLPPTVLPNPEHTILCGLSRLGVGESVGTGRPRLWWRPLSPGGREKWSWVQGPLGTPGKARRRPSEWDFRAGNFGSGHCFCQDCFHHGVFRVRVVLYVPPLSCGQFAFGFRTMASVFGVGA